MHKFQNYHRHSMYTNTHVADSVTRNEGYAVRAVELGHGIISTCEHGEQGRYIEGYELAEKYNLKFVFSVEAYWVKDRLEKDRSNCHIFLAAKNENGRQAINDVLSEANITGFYGQPRVDVELLLSLPSDDVIVTTACIAYWKYDDVEEITKRLASHFKYFYLEVQYHNTQKQIEINQRIMNLHRETGLPIIMGCDSHYIKEVGAQERADFVASKGMVYEDEQGWFMDYPDGDTAYERFAKQGVLGHDDIVAAMDNTNIFLEVEIYDNPCFNHEIKMPTLYPELSQEERDNKYLDLIDRLWQEEKVNVPQEKWPLYEAEIKKETDIVLTTKHADYFLLDYQIVQEGKRLGGVITSTGRGSAPSFYTVKLMGITDVDRISASVKMYPERFMSPTRILETKSIADLDMNLNNPDIFAEAQRNIFGEGHSYPMRAYGTMKPKAAWKMFAKSQNVDFELSNKVSEQIERFENALKLSDEDTKDLIDVNDFIAPEFQEIFSKSETYRGIISHHSPHPCAYLIYTGDIRKEIGLVRIKDKICCVMDGLWAEQYKFLKNDLLKVSVVDMIDKVYKRIGIPKHTVKQLLEICQPDHPAWNMYKIGCTLGLNQVEQRGTSSRVGKYKPTNISELCAFVAAIRPGFKSMYKTFENREHFEYGVPAFDQLIQTLEMPNSFVLYQEQSMAALNYAGIPLAECYEVIKNIAKKRVDKVLKYKEKFISGFSQRLVQQDGAGVEFGNEVANKVWQILDDSSRYSFNACVAGRMRLDRAQTRSDRYHPNIEEMYRIKNDVSYAKETNHLPLHSKYLRTYGVAKSLFDDGRIHINNIKDILYSGNCLVYRVTTEAGKTIECTLEHKFPTPNGEKMLMNLKEGDNLYVIGEYEKNKSKNNFTKDGASSENWSSGHRGFMNVIDGESVKFHLFRNKMKDEHCSCKSCHKAYEDGDRFEAHHVDGCRYHNDADNLMWLCVSCHKKIHYKDHNRAKVYEKGIPVNIEKIVNVECLGKMDVYDVVMTGPAHNFVVESGIITSNSHSYSVAIDSLYCAFLKAMYPMQFYEVYLQILEVKGDKDKMNSVKEEASSYFGIEFVPFKFGQDNRNISADVSKKQITKSLASIKGFGDSVGEIMYECSQQNFSNFVDVLVYLNAHGIKEAKTTPLINIDFFGFFGTISELLMVSDLCKELKYGEAKQLNSIKANIYKGIIEGFATNKNDKGKELANYKFFDCTGFLRAMERHIKTLNLPDISLGDKLKHQQEILGYIDIATHKTEDLLKLVVMEKPFPIVNKKSGNVWKYRADFKSIGSGKVARLSIDKYDMTVKPLKEGDIIDAYVTKDISKKTKEVFWNLSDYKQIDKLGS